MVELFVNGQSVQAPEGVSLLRFLRDELHLTSVKDGCSEGACGTCTVIIDGKTAKACVFKTERLAGRHILTVEGLSAFERDVYSYAFGEAGAVQCGFCIPGMVLCAKALLDVCPSPNESDVRKAIRGNICRCTGYVKIIKAILLAAHVLRVGKIPDETAENRLGSPIRRIDVCGKVTGTGQYPDDIYIDGMLYGSALRSAYPRAVVKSIDVSAARALDGVEAVLTAADIPGKIKVGHLVKDWDTLIPVGGVTHYLGDAIALVAARDYQTVEKAKSLINVEYEELEPIRSPYEAMTSGAGDVHPAWEYKEGIPMGGIPVGNLLAHKHVARGDAKAAIASSSHVLKDVFHTPWTEHAFLEPECAVAEPFTSLDGVRGVNIYSSDQGAYDTRGETAPMLGLPVELVRVKNMLVGGGFGGKEDVTVQHHAALLSYITGKPVKVKLTRAESLLIHPKRHPMDMEFTLGCDENGIIRGVMANVIADTGAYASLGGPVLERACTHASGPYNYQNFEIDGYAYYTNNPPAGAFRGFGVTQTCFAIESLLSRMADVVGISSWEIRWRNAIRPMQELPNGQITDGATALAETLLAVKDAYDSAKIKGIACAMKNSGVGVGLPDWGRARLAVTGARLHIFVGGSCIGQGLGTVLLQMAGEATGLSADEIIVEPSTTFDAPDSGTTSGSRHTLISGEAVRRACVAFNAARNGRSLIQMEGEEFYGEYLAKTDRLGADVKNPVSHVAYGYATQLCILNDDGTIREIAAAHDVGRVVNPQSCEGQIEGGVLMSCGFALTESFPLENCRPTAKFGTLGLFRADKAPLIRAILVEKQGLNVAFGAKGIGEITSIPTAPAVAEAYYRLDGVKRNSLPLINTPYGKNPPQKP